MTRMPLGLLWRVLLLLVAIPLILRLAAWLHWRLAW